MTVERLPDWENALQAYLDSKRDTDEPCAYFAAGAVKVTTGTDLLPKFRGRMTWARDHLAEAVGEVLDPRPLPFARSGDLVMKDGNLGVCYGAESAFVAMGGDGATGLTMVATLECQEAFTVG